MTPRSSLAVLLTCCFISPLRLSAWWETGHQAIARIAAAHLTPAARTRVARILDVPDTPEAVADALARASTWADETKKDTNTGAWHYIDLTLQDTKSDIPARCPGDNCAPARIRLFAAELASHPADARWSQLDALRYVVHFVGDVHQPLHTISDADLGGNCELLDPPIDKAKNLHALWDGVLVDALNPNDKLLAADLEHEILGFGAKQEREAAAGNQDDWVWQSHQLAQRIIYQRFQIPVEPVEFPQGCQDAPSAITQFQLHIDTAYIDEMKPIVRLQLEKAGLRLAKILNQSL